MPIDNLRSLFLMELKDLYDAEHQITKALPKMKKAASSSKLQNAFEQHLEQTNTHVERLEQVFKMMGEKPKRETCDAMKGLISEAQDAIKEVKDSTTLDAALIAAAQRVEHYEMAGYGTVRTYAMLLNQDDAAELLQRTLDEEGETDKKLTDLARQLNPQAV